LSSHDINASNLFGDGVLDLDSRVDLDKVVPVLLVDQELGGTGVAVVDRLGKPDGIGQDGIASFDRKIFGRGEFDDLLVTSLNGAVTLVQVDDIAVTVSQQLDLNVLGLVEEALDEDGAVTKGRLGLGGSTLERVL